MISTKDLLSLVQRLPEESQSEVLEVLYPVGRPVGYYKYYSEKNGDQKNKKRKKKRNRIREKINENKRQRFAIFARDGFRCHYCGASPHQLPEVALMVDHIIPKASGGKDTPDNLITSCSRCNLEKSARVLDPKLVAFLSIKEGKSTI